MDVDETDATSLSEATVVVEAGDLVINRCGLDGHRSAVSACRGIVSRRLRGASARDSAPSTRGSFTICYASTEYADGDSSLHLEECGHVDCRRQRAGFGRLPIPVPPLEEQRAIADYLDRETARIDTLIEEQQRLIEMLRERRSALRTHVFCTGLLERGDDRAP